MKRFSFSLQKLLDYKQQMLDLEQSVLLEMRSVLQGMEQSLNTMEREYDERMQYFNERATQGITIPEMQRQKTYLHVLQENMQYKRVQIRFQTLAIDKQTDKVREGKIELSSIEKLREKKYEEYLYKQSKAQELFIEEFVSHAKTTQPEAI